MHTKKKNNAINLCPRAALPNIQTSSVEPLLRVFMTEVNVFAKSYLMNCYFLPLLFLK